MARPVLRTGLCDLLHIEYPILLAGMATRGGWATPPKLVAAVSNAGGLGVLGATGMTPSQMRQCIREIRQLTDKPFGVDLLLPARLEEAGETRSQARERVRREYPQHWAFARSLMERFGLPEAETAEHEEVMSPAYLRQQVEVVLQERVPVFAAALGDPAWLVPQAHAQGMLVIGMAGSVRNAQRQVGAGVDIVVAQGHEAGGHTGRIPTFPLVPQVVDAVRPKPVVAAGGIADGRGVAAALALGAVGAWVGTAFLVAQESEIHQHYKEGILKAASEDFVVSRTYTGKTARTLKNAVIEAWTKSGLEPLPMPLQGVLMEDLASAALRAGRHDLVFQPAGQIGGMLKETKPAARIMEELVTGAVETLEALRRHTSAPLH
ncbi:MAG: nitronate monooxygenase [Chloroflexi bacterium]|nr:nitronate monooxygenase [Chloroflexota bacterium]